MENNEFNTKCAEYLGWTKTVAPMTLYKLSTIYWTDNNKKDYWELKFDSDWNWIMLVLEAILEECSEDGDLDDYNDILDSLPFLEDTKQAIINYWNN